MKFALFLIAVLLVAATAPAFACVDFTCDSSCCMHELVLQHAPAHAILPAIPTAHDPISISPIRESSVVIFETIVPTARTPLRI